MIESINSLETLKIEIPQPHPEAHSVVLPDPMPMPAMPSESVNTWLVANEAERKERRAFRARIMLAWLVFLVCWSLTVYIDWRMR